MKSDIQKSESCSSSVNLASSKNNNNYKIKIIGGILGGAIGGIASAIFYEQGIYSKNYLDKILISTLIGGISGYLFDDVSSCFFDNMNKDSKSNLRIMTKAAGSTAMMVLLANAQIEGRKFCRGTQNSNL